MQLKTQNLRFTAQNLKLTTRISALRQLLGKGCEVPLSQQSCTALEITKLNPQVSNFPLFSISLNLHGKEVLLPLPKY